MKRFLLLVIIVGAIFGYLHTLGDEKIDSYKYTAEVLFGGLFDFSGDDVNPKVGESDSIGARLASRLVVEGGSEYVYLESENGKNLMDSPIYIGAYGEAQHPWEAEREYSTENFLVFDEAGDRRFTVSVIDVCGSDELAGLIEFKVVNNFYGTEHSLEDFVGGVVAAGEYTPTTYKIKATMPSGLEEKYYGMSISQIMLEIVVSEN